MATSRSSSTFPRRAAALRLLGALGLSALLACGPSTAGAPPEVEFPADALATEVTASGLKLELRTSPQPPARGVLGVQYRVTTATGAPVDGLSLDVVPWMPDMGHGAATKPEIQTASQGTYVLPNVYLAMPGRWELRTHLTGPGAIDELAAPALQIP